MTKTWRVEDKKVGILGLGIMGKALADNLNADGHLAACWNRSPKPDFPHFKNSLSDVLDGAKVIFIVLIDGPAVLDVVEQLLPMLTNEHIVVQTATIKPEESIETKKLVESVGANYIEALMGGSELAAKTRKLPLYLGGEVAIINYLRPLLETLSHSVIHVGEVGKACSAKLAMNLNLAIQLTALCESYTYAIESGLSDDQYFQVLRNNTGWNFLCEYKEPKLRLRDYEPQFALKNMLKDIRLSLATDKSKHGLKLLKNTEAIYSQAKQAGYGEEDMVALLKLMLED